MVGSQYVIRILPLSDLSYLGVPIPPEVEDTPFVNI